MRRKIHTRRKNNTTLLILLLTFFVFDNIFLSFSNYIQNRMDECPAEKTLRVYAVVGYEDVIFFTGGGLGDYDPEKTEEYIASGKAILQMQFEKFVAHIQNTDGVVSWTKRRMDADGSFISYKNGEEVRFNTNTCTYELIKDYLLTEGCGEPGSYEVILPKYYGTGAGRDWGSWLFSKEELNYVEYDAEELVGKTITGTSYGQEIALKVIGVYDNHALGLTNELCYGEETVAALEAGVDELNLLDEDMATYWEENCNVEFHVTCETRADMLALADYIDENLSCLAGSVTGSMDEGQVMVVTAFAAAGDVILAFLLVNLIVNIIYTEEQMVFWMRREYGLMKAEGYRTADLALVHVKETAKGTLAALALVFGIGAVIFFVLNLLMDPFLNYAFSTFRIRMLPGVSAVTLLVAIGAGIIGNVVGLRRIAGMQVVEALKGEAGS